MVSAEYGQLLLPKLTDEQLATSMSYGTKEQTSVGQILAAAGDLSYDLMVVLEGEVECSDMHEGRRRAGPADLRAGTVRAVHRCWEHAPARVEVAAAIRDQTQPLARAGVIGPGGRRYAGAPRSLGQWC